jgi:hypothetical protein
MLRCYGANVNAMLEMATKEERNFTALKNRHAGKVREMRVRSDRLRMMGSVPTI